MERHAGAAPAMMEKTAISARPTPSQMKMLLTRLGQGSKMVVTGDLQQADRPCNNGLLEFLQLYNNFDNHRYVDICHFTVGDIERHEAVKEILAIYGDS